MNLIYLFIVLFFNSVLSYFAKPNFIVYDEWFDYDLEQTKLNLTNKELKNFSKIHEFFYKQSNYKVGASENNLQIDINLNRQELFNSYFENNSDKYYSLSNKKFTFLEKLIKNKIKFNFTKKIIYSLSIFGFVFISGFFLFFISQSEKNESKIMKKSIGIEKNI